MESGQGINELSQFMRYIPSPMQIDLFLVMVCQILSYQAVTSVLAYRHLMHEWHDTWSDQGGRLSAESTWKAERHSTNHRLKQYSGRMRPLGACGVRQGGDIGLLERC